MPCEDNESWQRLNWFALDAADSSMKFQHHAAGPAGPGRSYIDLEKLHEITHLGQSSLVSVDLWMIW